MARGEPLSSKWLINNGTILLHFLASKGIEFGLYPKFNISTIFPQTFKKSLTDAFGIYCPTIYYSLYSVHPRFRAKWLPAAMPVSDAISILKQYQSRTKKIIKIHYALIKDENDSILDAENVLYSLRGLSCEFNIVRYNPYSEEQGMESTNIQEYVNCISKCYPCKIIPRVGIDVKASCGMFVEN